MTDNIVWAQRGSEKRAFSESIWKAMSLNSYGWRLVAEEPEIVKRMKLAGDTTPETYARLIAETRKSGDIDKLNDVLNATTD